MTIQVKDIMDSLDHLSDDELAMILAKLEVLNGGSQKVGDGAPLNVQTMAACPHCGSISLKKNGFTTSGAQRYRCKDCGGSYTETNGTIVHHSRLSEEQWRAILTGIVQNLSLSKIADMSNLSITSVWVNKLKVCQALKDISTDRDIFVDIAECDEYYTPVSFKGKRDAAFFINVLHRMPRHHRNYIEKVEWLKKHGFWDSLQEKPELLEMFLSSSDSYKRGISNDQVCILTCRDRSENLTIDPACVGRLEIADVQKCLAGRFAKDAILVTDSHNSYPAFAQSEGIQHEQIEADKHSNGAFNLARINALHSIMSSYFSKSEERTPSTKHLDLHLTLFRWLEKNKSIPLIQKVDVLYNIISTQKDLDPISYEEINDRKLTLNTKNLFPQAV